MIFEIIQKVETYSGSSVDERPTAFIYQDNRYEIIEIIDRWYEGGKKAGTPIMNYFKVKAKKGKVFLLRHNLRYDSWAVLMD